LEGNKTTLSRIKEIMVLIFPNLTKEEIRESTARSDIEKWDSLQHLNLIMSLESEFEIQFTPEEIRSIKKVSDIKRIIEKKMNSDK